MSDQEVIVRLTGAPLDISTTVTDLERPEFDRRKYTGAIVPTAENLCMDL